MQEKCTSPVVDLPSALLLLLCRCGTASVEDVALLDSGASHNFIGLEKARSLEAKLIKQNKVSVKLADGHKIVSSELCILLM